MHDETGSIEAVTVRKNQVVRLPDESKYVATIEHPLPDGATIAADKPHADGDYSYMCNSAWCRCSD